MEEVKGRILCVDDDEDTCEMMTILLGRLGYRVITTDNLNETQVLLEKGRFDLLILDNKLTDGSGVDLCKQLRQEDSPTPILFVSAKAYEADINEAMEAGAQAYLTKPIDVDSLEQIVSELVA
jgi:DNA-binding response OmpR family regulator